MPVASCRLICVLTLVLSAASHAANITVTNLNDAGAGSLRQAVIDANTNQEPANTIDFAVTGTIMLSTGAISITSTLTINGPAGGIVIDGTNNQQQQCLVSGNGIFIVNGEGQVTATFNDLTIQNGNGGDTAGGGAIAVTFVSVVANRCTFLNNSSTSFNGGGAIGGLSATLTVTNCTFDGNTAPNGGGEAVNAASFSNSGSLTVINCTSTDSMSANGSEGVIPFSITNSIVTTTVTGATASSNNLIGNNPDPLLLPLANNGGPTRTFALQSTSPARNAGATGASIPTIDQRGLFRGTEVDIGAFEFVLPPVITSVTIPQTVNECDTVTIVVDAFDPQGAPITITYDYGDGSSPDGTGSHVYCTPGTFIVTVTVTSTSGTTTVPSQLTVIPKTVVPTTPASLKFRVLRGIIKFAGGADTIAMQGVLHIPANFTPAGKVVLVKIGTIERSFTLDASGAGTSGSDTFALRATRARPKAYEGRFKSQFAGAFGDALKASVPLNASGSPEQILVQITFLDKVLTNRSLLKYSKGNSSLATFRGGGMD